jgi:hypothetical protein
MWYETLYDSTMWSLGCSPARSIKFLPLCPKPIVYSGTWAYVTNASGYINSDCHKSQTSGSYVQYNFTGTGVRIIGDTGPDQGDSSVYLDNQGSPVATIHAYGASVQHQVVLYETNSLTSATHKIKVVAAGSAYVTIDAFQYTYSWQDVNNNYDTDYPTSPTYGSGWSLTDLFPRGSYGYWGDYSGYWQDNYHSSHTVGSTATMNFTGTGLRIIGDTGTDHGKAEIYIDGSGTPAATIDTYSSSLEKQQQLYEVTGLTKTTHSIQLKIISAQNTNSTDHYITIDEYKYLPDAAVWGTANDNDKEGYRQYLSSDTDIIDYHLQQMTMAKIDFVLFDLTNGELGTNSTGGTNLNYMGGYDGANRFFVNNARTFCTRLKAWNDSHTWKIRYAIACGTWWNSGSDGKPGSGFANAAGLANSEAWGAFNTFYNNSSYGGPDNYYQLDGKPLLVIHDGGTTAQGIIDTINTTPTSYPGAANFSLRPSGAGSGDGAPAGWYGWWAPRYGPQYTDEMTFMHPGHNSHTSWAIKRDYANYYKNGWSTILGWSPKPKIVLIASFNEYIEDNAVWTADTTYLDPTILTATYPDQPPRGEQWQSSTGGSLLPWLYWDLTVSNVYVLRGNAPYKYRTINANTGELLDAYQLTDGQNPYMWEDVAAASQPWEIVYTGSGSNKFVNHSTGKRLDAYQITDGANPFVYSDLTRSSQFWRIDYAGSGWNRVVNDGSFQVLDAYQKFDGDYPYIWPDVDAESQHWRLEPFDDGAWTVVNGDAAAVTFEWGPNYYVPGFVNTDCHSSKSAWSTAQLTFTGTGIKIVGDKNSDHGIANIYIDGSYITTVDNYAATWSGSTDLYVNTGLSSGTHTIVFQLADYKNASSTDYFQSLDAFKYYNGAWNTVNDFDPSIVYGWGPNWPSGFINDDCDTSLTANSYVELAFTGTAAKVIGDKNSDHGIAYIYVDGVYHGSVDTYSAIWLKQQELYAITGLASGSHTVRFTLSSSKNASSSNFYQSIDGFKIK